MASQPLVISGRNFTVPAPYTAGHVLTSAEAIALNQALAARLANNLARQVRKAIADGVDPEPIVTEYAQNYRFRTEIESEFDLEVRRIAKESLMALFRKNGIAATPTEDQITTLISTNPDISQEADRRVRARQDLLKDFAV